jgi:hypothetical protein
MEIIILDTADDYEYYTILWIYCETHWNPINSFQLNRIFIFLRCVAFVFVGFKLF